MNLTQFLAVYGIRVESDKTKVHFAYNQGSDPLFVFYEGKFQEWQEEQTRKNFSGEYVLSLIQLQDKKSWLYAGLYKVVGLDRGTRTAWQYHTEPLEGQESLVGRVVVQYGKGFRQPYPFLETVGSELEVVELLRKRAQVADFPGYKNVLLSKQALDVVISQNIESWRSALSSVSGIYVIADRSTGNHYVGSAYSEGGIWSRWSEYSASGHGDTKELRTLLRNHGKDYANNFQFSILEVYDLDFSKEQIIERESHWKKVLCTREHGLNSN